MKIQLNDARMIELNDNISEVEVRRDIAVHINSGLMDADSGFFFERQLEYIQAQTYDYLYKDLMFRQVIPVNNEGGPGISSFTYRSYSKVGKAKLINSAASDLPRSDAEGKEFTFKVESIGASYGYDIDEINAARYSGAPLDARRAESARRSVEEKLNDIAFYGDENGNLPGLFPNTTIPVTTYDGTTRWAPLTGDTTLTPEETLLEVNLLFSSIDQESMGKHRPDTLLLPRDVWNYFMTTRSAATAATDMTIAKFLVANSPYLSSIDDMKPINECSDMDGDGTNVRVAVAYEKSPMNLEFILPQEVQFFNVQERNLEFIIPARARVVGTIVRYPMALRFARAI